MNDREFIQNLISLSTNNNVVIPNGIYNIDKPILLNKSINVDFSNSTIINQNTSARNTADAIFLISGSIKQVGSCQGKYGSTSIVVNLKEQIVAGDIICTQADYTTRNISTVVSINGTNLILDRPLSIDCGSNLYKISPIRDISIGNINVDFNRKYGHGVYARFAHNLTIHNINAKNLGSKCILLESSDNCKIKDINCEYGFDVSGDGGCGYVTRLSVCNDCIVENVRGSRVRHVVDLSGSNRNIVRNCIGFNNFSADFLTHGNNSRYNSFEGNTTFSNQTAAYSFTTKSGDTNNRIISGTVNNSVILYQIQDGSTTVKDLYVSSQEKYSITCQGNTVFDNCIFDCWYTLITSIATTSVVMFNNCKFLMNNPYSLASNNLGTIIFNNCTFISSLSGKMIRNSNVRFNSCQFVNCSESSL